MKEIQDPRRGVFFSAASAWELELKSAKGKLRLPNNWLDAATETGFLEIPVTAKVARASAHLPWHNNDPFDRLIVAQAIEHRLRLATRDRELENYGVMLLEV